ncbi:MAG: Radical SAM domain protein [Parcubacteria group bacterium GW2011_GWD2_40_9]|nr:MAG: Radical SAM domain protein [Parcubacteria group bacterium GW2011_GWD2_40_9]
MNIIRKKVLLIYPHSSIEVFASTKIRVAIPVIPYISLAMIGGSLLRDGHDVHILDLSVSSEPERDIDEAVKDFKPQYIGISFTSALSKEAIEIVQKIKKINSDIIAIAGGVHSTTLPEETLKNSSFDIAVIGEGEDTMREIISGKNYEEILGIAYKKNGEIKVNSRRPFVEDIDSLPLPAWHLYDIKKYHTPRINSRRNPVGAMETSRGCPFTCVFCNKTVFARIFRAKSAERVVDEMEYMLRMGFREIHIWEDGFSTDLNRAKEICRLIIKRKLYFPWNIYNGIRVDRIDEELLRLLKKAGCYRISIGIESGNQNVIKIVNKGITLEQIRRAVKIIKEAGIESLGFFMVGLPGDTEGTMQDTINFAKELKLDLPKVGMLMPLPGTPVFADWEKKGLIKSRDWSKYIFHAERSAVYSHPNLDFATIRRYYDKFYRELYLSPRFIWKRFWRGLRTGDIFYDIYYFLKIMPYGWFNSTLK